MFTSSRSRDWPDSPAEAEAGKPLSISVAMATYNGEKFILEQLQSLAAQTVLPDELVVSDDGSTDSTLDIVDAFAKSAPFPVKIHRNNTRLGFANNFLHCAGLCTSELVAFCDQDDIWLDKKLERCRDRFIDQDVLLCIHNAKVWSPDETDSRHWPAFNKSVVLEAGIVDPLLVYPGFAMVVRKRLLSIIAHTTRPANIHSLSSNPHPMSHDQWAWFIAAIFGKMAWIAETLALYRQHGGNTYGAGARRGIAGALRLSMNNLSYALQAQLSTDCAKFLNDARTMLPADLQLHADRAISRFSKRANWQTMRARLYARESSTTTRLRTYLQMLISGGYSGERTKTSLGLKAAAKDLLYGVAGIYRISPLGGS